MIDFSSSSSRGGFQSKSVKPQLKRWEISIKKELGIGVNERAISSPIAVISASTYSVRMRRGTEWSEGKKGRAMETKTGLSSRWAESA